MKTIRERRSSSGQASRCSGGCTTCWTPFRSSGPAPPTFSRPLTRSTSLPRLWSSIVSQIPKAPQSSSSSMNRQHDRTSPWEWASTAGTDLSSVPSGAKSASGSTSPNETSKKVAQLVGEVAAHRAADAAVAEHDRPLVHLPQEVVVDRNLAELVDDHRRLAHIRVGEQPREQRRLPAAEVAGEERDRRAHASAA